MSLQCTLCLNKQRSRYLRLKLEYEDLKLEMIKEQQCSCYICKSLYFKPNENSLIVPRIDTYLKKDKKRYFQYNGLEYSVNDIKHHYLELSIIQFDHLTEEEQRNRGLLLPNEGFVPKRFNMARVTSTDIRKRESLKTQLLCIYCHIKQTIRRERGDRRKTNLAKQKISYINKLKENGCVSCGFKDLSCPRFFDMDHLAPEVKIDSVGDMIDNPAFSLNDIILECSKCRVLCKHCHAMHTKNQVKREQSGRQK